MFNKLSNKLVITLLGLLLSLSTIFITFTINSLPALIQEVNQKLNLNLANNIVTEKNLLIDNQVNKKALQSVFMGLMLVITMMGGLASPVFAGWVFDVTGGYRLAWQIFALTTLPAIPLVLLAIPPRPKRVGTLVQSG